MATPKRKFRFVSGSTLQVDNTSFEVLYNASAREDGPALLSFTLRGVWELASGADGLAKRKMVEDRFKELHWDWVGKIGTLTIALATDGTWAGTGSRVISNARLDRVSPEQSDNNAVLEYSLDFSIPISGRVARTLSFGMKNVTAENFIVHREGEEDRTTFKPCFRAGFVRIPDGPALKITRVTAIRQAVSGGSDLLKRQAVETEWEYWAFTAKGTEALLSIDGGSSSTHHLRGVSPISTEFLDAIAFDLEFVSNYGS